MSTTSNRRAPKPPAGGQLTLQQAPELPKPEGASNTLMMALPMVGSLGSVAVLSLTQGGDATRTYIMGGMFLFMALSMVGGQMWRQKSQHSTNVENTRREYLAYLAETRDAVREVATRQRRYDEWMLPAPETLPFIVEEGSRVWEHAATSPEFLVTRIGTATQPLAMTLDEAPIPALAQLDPVSASAAHRFVLTHDQVPDLPLALDLGSCARLEIVGDRVRARGLARAVVAHLATFVAPEDLQVAVVASGADLPYWEWAKWLPHAQSDTQTDAVGGARRIGSSWSEIEPLVVDIRSRGLASGRGGGTVPHLVVVLDGAEPPAGHPLAEEGGVDGVTVIDLAREWAELSDPLTTRLIVEGEGGSQLTVARRGYGAIQAAPDFLGIASAEAVARRLTGLGETAQDDEAAGGARAISAELTDLLGLPDVRDFDPELAWKPRSARDRLRVPIGLTATGQPMILDIKESAQQGMGPHGMLIGATGSGKSEVLRTLVLSLALTHSSEALNFVLIDFKGGATFAGMADMPHVSAVITNLGDDLTLVDRMQDAIQGEMTRRQELLRDAGNFANVTDYEAARKGGRTDLKPLPALLIVADEFSELLAAKPDFTELFVAIGRLGRSLQVHLLLSTQRLEEGKLRGLDSHLSYRIGLKTFSGADSRAVIGVPDAFTLPGGGGHGILKSDAETLTQFRAAYVSAPPKTRRRRPGSAVDAAEPEQPIRAIEARAFTAAPVIVQEEEPALEAVPEAAASGGEAPEKRVTFDIAVSLMKGRSMPAHQVWLPPLDVPATFDELLGDLTEDPQLGLISPRWRQAGPLTIPLGIVDRPLEQRRDSLTMSLVGAGGHLAIVGGARSGKSTLARSVLTGIALTHTPHEVQFYVMDFGGGTFVPFSKMAHVAGVAGRNQPDVLRRMFQEVVGIVNARERYFTANAIDSIETYRRMRAQGRADDGYGDVFLIVDGWPTIRAEFEEMEFEIQALAGRALTFGVHLVVTTTRWMDFRTAIRDTFGSKLELRLGDTSDSEIDRKIAANVPLSRPGRGLDPTKHHMLTALPRVDGSGDPDTLSEGVEDLITRVNAAWKGPRGPKLRLLPEMLEISELRRRAEGTPQQDQVLLGVDEAELAPTAFDVKRNPHLYLFGDTQSGKSSFLRTFAHEIMRTATAKEAQFFVVDYRRALLSEIPDEYLAGYYTTAQQAGEELGGLTEYLRSRLPGPDVTPQQLRDRSWWSGAEVYVLVDDYDLVNTQSGNPIAVLQPLLAQATDVGLHLLLTRRSGGASRATFEPVMQTLRDLAAPGILLSGSPDEGALIGNVKATPAVPGRAKVITREHGLQIMQLAYAPSQL
ncbi:type VII secretion protein EccCa [Microbacterium sp. ARD32]|uniref:type VII secretion protein EccCa n=1 Tax=Microbacterium sp. ARD32 TaxID=2962577 RepID=UPI0028810CD1|nr:type VII secretion protein EccCa [Microbacterium sp. ARD32]MDT0156137.1 type VII secretion protein EccCa [Microbacterium sp. ARD32]